MVTISEILHGKTHKIIDDQVAVFVSYGKRNQTIGRSSEDWIKLFTRYCQKKDIWDVDKDDIDSFMEYVRSKYASTYMVLEAETAVRRIMRFYQARGGKKVKHFPPGRPKLFVRSRIDAF